MVLTVCGVLNGGSAFVMLSSTSSGLPTYISRYLVYNERKHEQSLHTVYLAYILT